MVDFFWSDSRDHALLALAIRETSPSGYIGRTALQKIVYFLHILNVPMSYKFIIHHYGPYSPDVSSDVDQLVADGVIVDRAAQSHYSSYKPSDSLDALVSRYWDELEPYAQLVSRVSRSLSTLKPQELELMATLHYAYRAERATGDTVRLRPRVIERFKSYKADKFGDTEIHAMYDKMVTMGLLRD